MQLHPLELYGLVELLDPTLFLSDEDFTDHRSRMRGLSQLVEGLSDKNSFITDVVPDNVVEEISEWLEETPGHTRSRLSKGESGLRETARLLLTKHRLSEILIRNRKNHIGGFMPRSANRWPVEMTDAERQALSAIEDYVNFGYSLAEQTQDAAIGFLMVIFQKLAASSHVAILSSLRRRKERLGQGELSFVGQQDLQDIEEQIDEDVVVSDVLAESGVIERSRAVGDDRSVCWTRQSTH